MKGNDLLVTSGNLIYAAKSCDVSVEGEVIETASPDSATWRTYIAGRKGWNVTCSYLVSASKFDADMLAVGSVVTVSFRARGIDDDPRLRGSAIVSKCNITGTRGNLAQGSIVLIGTGALSRY